LVKNGQENKFIRRFVMRVRVIQNKCGSVGMCVKTCPDIFRFQEGSKKATVIVDEVPPDLEQKCLKAADLCPNKAIVVLFE
jgi:ferredoxin